MKNTCPACSRPPSVPRRVRCSSPGLSSTDIALPTLKGCARRAGRYTPAGTSCPSRRARLRQERCGERGVPAPGGDTVGAELVRRRTPGCPWWLPSAGSCRTAPLSKTNSLKVRAEVLSVGITRTLKEMTVQERRCYPARE